ncbi:Predicted ATPase [Glycomyces sambucus]|uniref:Predicted ATPase n=1 Tax=Glycomyces sambucus TaxID=380244 RepID=A0A1G9MYI0_9ACTN|nr:AAA family ATPase [Glycomyces sambucus]SDL79332.1 Predicted ATPase [Glycomyces sambucus]
MITRIEAHNYRCFHNLAVDVDGFQVLAGANGAGKTTFLDIPSLLGDLLSSRGRISEAFLKRRTDQSAPRAHTISEVFHQGRGSALSFAIEAELPEIVTKTLADRSTASTVGQIPSHLRYELGLELFDRELQVSQEYLFLFSAGARRPEAGVPFQGEPRSGGKYSLAARTWESVLSRKRGEPARFNVETTSRGSKIPELRVPPGQLALGTILSDPGLFPASLWFSELLSEGVVFLEPDWERLRQAAPPGDPARLLPSYRNLPWLAFDLKKEDERNQDEDAPKRFEFWIDHVKAALPQVRSIDVIEREEDHHAYFEVCYTGGYTVTSSGLSEGTLRIMALGLLPYLPKSALPRLLVVEEPENGIYPRAIQTAVESLDSLHDAQVWLSTHSPIVLANTELSDVLISRLGKDGAVEVIPGDEHPQLRGWRGGLDTGSLFATGVLS